MIANCGEIDSMKPLAELVELSEVFFHESTNILDGNLNMLKNLPNLRDISFQERRHYNLKRKDFGQNDSNDMENKKDR